MRRWLGLLASLLVLPEDESNPASSLSLVRAVVSPSAPASACVRTTSLADMYRPPADRDPFPSSNPHPDPYGSCLQRWLGDHHLGHCLWGMLLVSESDPASYKYTRNLGPSPGSWSICRGAVPFDTTWQQVVTTFATYSPWHPQSIPLSAGDQRSTPNLVPGEEDPVDRRACPRRGQSHRGCSFKGGLQSSVVRYVQGSSVWWSGNSIPGCAKPSLTGWTACTWTFSHPASTISFNWFFFRGQTIRLYGALS